MELGLANNIISYLEMCQREGVSLQRGMNYRLGKTYSVVLMSVRPNAPYRDVILDDGTTLIYEGHDVPKTANVTDPKLLDQPARTQSGVLTENGKFYQAAQEYKKRLRSPESVRIYEKIRAGIWSYNGVFQLIDSWVENDGNRNVFKFKLAAIEEEIGEVDDSLHQIHRRRVIPTHIKVEVWKRDKGRCVICGAKEELHFDHIIPFSRGGTSLSVENIQLLCARHNLAKRDNIE